MNDKNPTKVERRKRCEYCNGLFKCLGRHQASCEAKKEWKKRLDDEGIIDDSVNGITHFSGGFKIWFMLGKNRKTEEDKVFARSLDFLEKKHNVEVCYDSGKDEVYFRDS